MSRQQTIDNIAVTVCTCIGAIFFIISLQAFKNLQADCKYAILRDGWTAILTMGSMMLTAGICFFICSHSSGANCYANNSIRPTDFYLGIFLLFSLVILGIVGSMINVYKSASDEDLNDCDNNAVNKKYLYFILVLTLLMAISCIVALFKIHFSQEDYAIL
jgi:NAD/NADP transhydrogenase beta subunit